jgi:thiamine-phosphate pyrophosphorylase
MREGCLLYYITDRTQFPGDERERRRALLAKIAEAAQAGVDYVQLREKSLGTRELEELAREAVQVIRDQRAKSHQPGGTRLLINSRTDIALVVGANGVHLRSDDVSSTEARSIVERSTGNWPLTTDHFFVAVSCHTPLEVARAAEGGADFAVFGPVFEKQSLPRVWPVGLDGLREACRSKIPVLALGGVTSENAALCFKAGAAGIAGIRLFQESKMEDVVRALRVL